MPRRIGLGRGLNALLDNNDEDDDLVATPEAMFRQSLEDTNSESNLTSAVSASEKKQEALKSESQIQLPIEKLFPNPGQPRKYFNETELKELADSIKTYGIIQPIIAADSGDGTYLIIAGERRTRAATLAGLSTVPAIIRDYTDQKRLEVSLIENIQRTDLNPIEEAAAYKNLMDFSNFTQDELALRIGKNRSTVANALRLLKLPVEMQKSIEEGKITSGHARALLTVTNAKEREKLFREILTGNLSVREAEKKAANEKSSAKTPLKKETKRPPEIDAMAEKFISRLGTKVVIEGDMNKGRIHIDYYSMEDLERLYEILGG